MHILISRTDSIGDVVLTLPTAGLIKEKYPEATITFLGRSYTESVIRLSQHVDRFLNWDDIEELNSTERVKILKNLEVDWILHIFPNRILCRDAKKARIKYRVGTSHRTYHWITCNRIVSFTRRRSDLHEAQLNCKLLSPLAIDVPALEVIHTYYGLTLPYRSVGNFENLLDDKRKNIILHPKSKGSAREWGLNNFANLIRILPSEQYKIFISGTAEDGELISPLLNEFDKKITNITGKFNLVEFIRFIANADAIVAASTGPLHIAAAMGTTALGIYPPIKPMHPGRWAPLGKNVQVLVKEIEDCNDCRKTMDCHCIREITPEQVLQTLQKSLID